jgi:hypothetical protein
VLLSIGKSKKNKQVILAKQLPYQQWCGGHHKLEGVLRQGAAFLKMVDLITETKWKKYSRKFKAKVGWSAI